MNVISKIQNKIVNVNDSILSALKRMDGHRTKLVFVFDEDSFLPLRRDSQRAVIVAIKK